MANRLITSCLLTFTISVCVGAVPGLLGLFRDTPLQIVANNTTNREEPEPPNEIYEPIAFGASIEKMILADGHLQKLLGASEVDLTSFETQWPEPGASLLRSIRAMPQSALRSCLLARIGGLMPEETLTDALANWNRADYLGLRDILSENQGRFNVLSDEIIKYLMGTKQSSRVLAGYVETCLSPSPELSVAQERVKFLLSTASTREFLLNAKILKRLSEDPSYLNASQSLLGNPQTSDSIPPRARYALAQAAISTQSEPTTTGLDAPQDNFIYRQGEIRKMSQDLQEGKIQLDELLFSAGSSRLGNTVAEEALWNLAKKDPSQAIATAMKSSDSQFSENLAKRLWLDWKRLHNDDAKRFAQRVNKLWLP